MAETYTLLPEETHVEKHSLHPIVLGPVGGDRQSNYKLNCCWFNQVTEDFLIVYAFHLGVSLSYKSYLIPFYRSIFFEISFEYYLEPTEGGATKV